MDETVTTDTTAPSTDAGTSPATSTGDVDFDTLIAQAEAANPDTATGATEAKPDDIATADTAPAKVEAKTDETQQPETDKAVPTEAEIDARRARKMLAEAKQHKAQAAHDFLEELRRNPRAALAKHKLSLEELIDADLATDSPKDSDDKKETELERRVAAAEKRLADREEADSRAELSRKINIVTEGMKADTSLTLINRSNSHGDVLDFMQEYYNTHGQPIPWQKAAALVEKDLRQRFGEPNTAKPSAKPVAAKSNEAPAKPAAGGNASGATSTMTNSEVRTASPSDEEPTDPDALIKFLVAKAERNSNQSH